MTQSAGIAWGGKRGWDLFREDREKGAFIPLENYIRTIIMYLPERISIYSLLLLHFVVVER